MEFFNSFSDRPTRTRRYESGLVNKAERRFAPGTREAEVRAGEVLRRGRERALARDASYEQRWSQTDRIGAARFGNRTQSTDGVPLLDMTHGLFGYVHGRGETSDAMSIDVAASVHASLLLSGEPKSFDDLESNLTTALRRAREENTDPSSVAQLAVGSLLRYEGESYLGVIQVGSVQAYLYTLGGLEMIPLFPSEEYGDANVNGVAKGVLDDNQDYLAILRIPKEQSRVLMFAGTDNTENIATSRKMLSVLNRYEVHRAAQGAAQQGIGVPGGDAIVCEVV